MNKMISTFITVISITVNVSSLPAQWVQTNGPSAGELHSLAVSNSNLYAGTRNGGLFLSTNNGDSWEAINNGITCSGGGSCNWITALVFIGGKFFAGTNGGVFFSTNSGASWSGINSGLWNGNVWTFAVSGTYLFAGTAGGVFRLPLNDTNWTYVSTGLTNAFINTLAISGSTLFAGTSSGVFLSTNDGANWSAAITGLTDTYIYAFAVSGTSVFVGTNGGIFRSANNGASWTEANTGLVLPTPVTAFAVSGTNIFAGMHSTSGGSMGIFLSTDNGSTWLAHSPGLTPDNSGGLCMVTSNNYLFIGNTGGYVCRRPLSEMTNSWLPQASPLGTTVLGRIQFVSSTEGWIVAGEGNLLHTTNAGENWSSQSPGGSDTVSFNTDNFRALSPLSFTDPTTGWVAGTLGSFSNPTGAVLYNTTNGGGTWNRQLLTGWSYAWGVQFVDANRGWVCVLNGSKSDYTYAVLKTTDAGTHWTTDYSIANEGFLAPYFIDESNGWAMLGYSIVCTTDGGATWNTQFSDNTPGMFNGIQFLDLNNGWVVGDSGKVFRTTDGGEHWTRILNAPTTSNHHAVFFANTNVGWIGSRVYSDQGEGMILHTTDGGASWTMEDTPSPQDINGIYFIDANNGWLIGEPGIIAKTTSGGGTTLIYENHYVEPKSFSLMQNYPNPFNPSTVVSYRIQSNTFVVLKVFDVLGREVQTLVNERQTAGTHSVTFNASNLPSGMYFYRLQAGTFVQTRKLIILK